MTRQSHNIALIAGAGNGLSASIARSFARQGLKIALASRKPEKLADLCAETGARAFTCDVADQKSVAGLFQQLDESFGAPDVVVYNPSARVLGPFVELDTGTVEDAIRVTAFGGFLVAQEAVRRMLQKDRGGTILFTGASASIKGYPLSAPFAMGKFALRGLAQSLARELHPQNIHVAHVVIDGGIRNPDRMGDDDDEGETMLDPEAIAETYLHLAGQDRSAWTWEVELRPWVEKF